MYTSQTPGFTMPRGVTRRPDPALPQIAVEADPLAPAKKIHKPVVTRRSNLGLRTKWDGPAFPVTVTRKEG
jgi:hypothetical protein